jgi:hypothetical protein
VDPLLNVVNTLLDNHKLIMARQTVGMMLDPCMEVLLPLQDRQLVEEAFSPLA